MTIMVQRFTLCLIVLWFVGSIWQIPVLRISRDCPSSSPTKLSTQRHHYSDVIMITMASQITSLRIVYSIDYSGADQRKHQGSASLAFVRGIHRWPVISPHKWQVTRKTFPFDDVIMIGAILHIWQIPVLRISRDCPSSSPTKLSTQRHHYSDVIMITMASQITSLRIVYSIDYSGADQRKHQGSASLAFVRGIHRWPVISPHKWQVTRKTFPFDDVIMIGAILHIGCLVKNCAPLLSHWGYPNLTWSLPFMVTWFLAIFVSKDSLLPDSSDESGLGGRGPFLSSLDVCSSSKVIILSRRAPSFIFLVPLFQNKQQVMFQYKNVVFSIYGFASERNNCVTTSYRYVVNPILNTLRPRQKYCHFADDILKCIFLNKDIWISIKISLMFVPKGPINISPGLVQIMAWCRPGDKPLSEPTMVRLLTHICVNLPQWVKRTSFILTPPLHTDYSCPSIYIYVKYIIYLYIY